MLPVYSFSFFATSGRKWNFTRVPYHFLVIYRYRCLKTKFLIYWPPIFLFIFLFSGSFQKIATMIFPFNSTIISFLPLLWIRIRIDYGRLDPDPHGIGNVDPDPGWQKWHIRKEKSEKVPCFEVLDAGAYPGGMHRMHVHPPPCAFPPLAMCIPPPLPSLKGWLWE